jgi:hypothetical protein
MNIESRIARLEAQNRLLKGVALMALALAILPWMMGSEVAIQDHVQARQFTLIGNDDAPAGSWNFNPETGTVTFRIQAARLSPSVVLASSGGYSTVRLLGGTKPPPGPPVRPARNPDAFPNADIALTAGNGETAINVDDGFIAIKREGKKAFVVPPQATFLPVTGE